MPESEIAEGNEAETPVEANEEKFLIFSISGQYYTFPSQYIGEIALYDAVYPLPLMPVYIPGVINRYSIPYALFDIGLLMSNTPSTRSKVLVLKDSIDRIAFLIDDVISLADIPKDCVLGIDRTGETHDATEMVSASFSWSGSNVFLLDIQRILARVSADVV